MAAQRKSIDCRDYPSEKNCSLKISGTPELREQIKSMLKDERD